MNKISIDVLAEIMQEIKEDVKEIKAQTQKTNGRVNALEIWRGFITGGLAVISFIIGYIIFFLEKRL